LALTLFVSARIEIASRQGRQVELIFVDASTGSPVHITPDPGFLHQPVGVYAKRRFRAENTAPNAIRCEWHCPTRVMVTHPGYQVASLTLDDDEPVCIVRLKPVSKPVSVKWTNKEAFPPEQ